MLRRESRHDSRGHRQVVEGGNLVRRTLPVALVALALLVHLGSLWHMSHARLDGTAPQDFSMAYGAAWRLLHGHPAKRRGERPLTAALPSFFFSAFFAQCTVRLTITIQKGPLGRLLREQGAASPGYASPFLVDLF